jgi:hypothetical protein
MLTYSFGLRKILFLTASAAFLANFYACSASNEEAYIPNLDNIQPLTVQVQRTEQFLAKVDTNNKAGIYPAFVQNFADFAGIYSQDLLKIPTENQAMGLATFASAPETRQLLDTVAQKYPDLKTLQAQTELLLRYKKYYFPTDTFLPQRIYTFISYYNYGVLLLPNAIGVGLDCFLGEQHPAYFGIELLKPAYIRRTLTSEHIIAKIAEAFAVDIMEQSTKRAGNKLIDYMLYEGKKLYLMEILMPAVADSIRLGFSDYQVQYCQKGEEGLYDEFRKENLLYSEEIATFRKYISLGAFAPEKGLFGNSGSWLGKQMVAQYVQKQRRKSGKYKDQKVDAQLIMQMLKETEPQAFLSQYKPTRTK